MVCFKRCANLWCFLVIFCLCYFFETITFTFMISAVQSVERHFQIPSSKSGTLIAASDIGYVLTVVVLAYLGSKGNRARWIGGGCVLISLACFLAAMPNFLFPVEKRVYSHDFIVDVLSPKQDENATRSSIRSDPFLENKYLEFVYKNSDKILQYNSTSWSVGADTKGAAISDSFIEFVRDSLEENVTAEWKALSILPFTFCNETVRKLKKAIEVADCEEKQTNNAAYGIFLVAIALLGVGHSMPWTLGMPLLDDNVSKKNTPFFFAGVFFIRILGPVLGFVLGGLSNKIYVTLNPPRGLSPTDPGWIGAWWLGFLVISATLFIPAVLLCCFPNMEMKHKKTTTRVDETDRNASDTQARQSLANVEKQEDFDAVGKKYDDGGKIHKVTTELKDFFVSLGRCLKSPVYTGALVGALFDAFAFKGYFVFQPKFIETQFGLPAYKVNYMMAVMGIIGFASGVVFGSLIMKKFKLDGRRAAAYVGVCALISVVCSFSEMFLTCNSAILTFFINDTNNLINDGCINNCSCDKTNLFPVCDVNRQPYFNPCYAGCRKPVVVSHDEPITFNLTECGCYGNETVSRDYCVDDCSTPITIYFVISTLSGIISGSAVIPGILIIIRSVPPELRSVALGFSSFVVSLLSTFPSPIVLGSIIDTTCILWEYTCGERGSCQIYDPTALRIRMHGFHVILRSCALIFEVWIWYWSKNLKLMDETLDDKKQTSDEEDLKQLRASANETS